MIELINCCLGFKKKPNMNKWTNANILSALDPLNEVIKDSSDEDYHETVYDSDKLRFHILENAKAESSNKFDPYHCFIEILQKVEKAIPWGIRLIEINENRWIIAYEILEDEDETEGFEELIWELIRITSTCIVTEKINEDDIVDLLTEHVQLNVYFEND